MTIDTSALAHVDGPSDDQLSEVSRIAEQQVALEEEVARMEKELSEKKAELQKVKIEHLPEAMKAVGMREFTLNDGTQISIKPDLSASIKVADQPDVFLWMRDHGHASIIKNEFKVPFKAGEDEAAETFRKILDEINRSDYNEREFIHPGTLKAWVKEQLREGNTLPEKLKVFEFDVAKVTKPKAGA